MSPFRTPDLAALLAQQPWVEGLARGLVRDSSLAEDLAQETWLRASRKGPDQSGTLRAFLAGMVRNVGRSVLRESDRRERRERQVARPEALPSSAELVERAELQRLLVESVLALDEGERTAILLRYFEGHTAEEIARQAREPAATVRSRIHRGLEKLRQRLEARMDRRDLFGGLLALARIPASGPLAPGDWTPGPAAHWIGGLLAVKTWMTLTAACIALLTVALWLTADGAETTRGQEPLDGSREGVSRLEPVLPALLVEESAEEGARQALGASARSEPEAPAVVERAPARLLARLVGPEGESLPGAQAYRHDELVGTAGPGGRLELELASGAGIVQIEFRRPGFARTRRGVRTNVGEVSHLGDVVLFRAANIRGWVEDEHGGRIAGARLVSTGLENERTDLEELRRLGPLEEEASVLAQSEEDGAFELADVPLGALRLWAGTENHAWESVGPLELSAADLDEIVMVLRPLSSLDHISGRILSPEGEAVPGAKLHTWFTAANFGSGGSELADEHGAFEILLQQRVAYDLTISDPENRWSEIYLDGVEPGTRDLELRFEPARWIEVKVVDGEGRAISAPTLGLESSTEGNWLRMTPRVESAGEESEADPEQGMRLRVPTARFRVTADAYGHEQAIEGPFEPASTPAALVFGLEALPGVHGVVLTSAGLPAAQAEVGLYHVVGPNIELEKDGFRLTTEDYTDTKTKTDNAGRFVLYPPAMRRGSTSAIEFVLRAEAPGHALTELAPRAFDPRERAELEVRLLEGGTLEGTAITAHGDDPSGTLIAFHRGDGEVKTLRLGPDGSYRLAGLTPGLWEVRVLDKELLGNRSSSSSTYHDDGAPPFEGWNCEVIEGETTRFDPDLSDFAPCHLQGSLELDERSLQRWTASLELADRMGDVIASVPLDSEGRFDLEATRAGTYHLVLRGPEESHGRLELREELELYPGETSWSLALRPGRIDGAGALGRGTRESFYKYDWAGSIRGHALVATQRIVPSADGRFTLPTVPEGPGKISRNEPPADGQEFAPWESLQEFEVPPGGSLSAILP